MAKYRVFWSLADDFGAASVVVEAESENKARRFVQERRVGWVEIPEELLEDPEDVVTADIHAEVESVELIAPTPQEASRGR